MGISDDVTAAVTDVVKTPWNLRDGLVVPETEQVALQNGAVRLDATYVYADLADSSRAAQALNQEVTAKIIRSFLNASTRILRHYQGQIRSFDGDRVMAIFVGNRKNDNAVRAALAINWAAVEVIWPKLKEQWPTLPQLWTMKHGVGIATGQALIVRGGVRNNNDLVSIGDAPNVAAKLSELRGLPATYITERVYSLLDAAQKEASGTNMWTWWMTQKIGGKEFKTLASTWHWKP